MKRLYLKILGSLKANENGNVQEIKDQLLNKYPHNDESYIFIKNQFNGSKLVLSIAKFVPFEKADLKLNVEEFLRFIPIEDRNYTVRKKWEEIYKSEEIGSIIRNQKIELEIHENNKVMIYI